MQVIGKLEEVHDVVKRTETFSVREFVLEISSPSSQYSEHVLFQLTNNRTNLVDQFQVGQEIVVDFDLQGRKWTNPEGRIVFFNRLNAWRISPYTAQMAQPQGGYQQPQPAYGYQQPVQPQAVAPQAAAPQQIYQQPQAAAPAPAPAAQLQSPAAPAGDDDLPF